MNGNEQFDFIYSAPTEKERREIENIKQQYADEPEKEDKLERLRRLNRKVKRPPLILSVAVGILGTLVLGVGMTMALEWNLMLWGVIVGVIGMAVCVPAYPIYKAVLKRYKQKYGRQIVDISNDLLNGQ